MYQYLDGIYQSHCSSFHKDVVKDNLSSYVSAVCSNKSDGFIIAEVCVPDYLVVHMYAELLSAQLAL